MNVYQFVQSKLSDVYPTFYTGFYYFRKSPNFIPQSFLPSKIKSSKHLLMRKVLASLGQHTNYYRASLFFAQMNPSFLAQIDSYHWSWINLSVLKKNTRYYRLFEEIADF